jgi:hypothetical protein
MMQGPWFQEARYRHKDVELIADHDCSYLQSVIEKASAVHARCFNFALPGSMASDMCMVSKAIFQGDHKPRIIVLGLSPRDLVDNTFQCAASSKHFQFMARAVNTDGLDDLMVPQWWLRPKFWFHQVSYFNRHARDFQTISSETVHQELASCLDPVLNRLPPSPLDVVQEQDRRFALFKDELQRGIWIAHPGAPWYYNESASDCHRRLRKPDKEMLANQGKWLELTLDYCKQEGITPIILNMPVSDEARQNMHPGIYPMHMAMLQSLANRWSCSLIDANTTGSYSKRDFTDWAHLSDTGGQKLLDLIGERIATDSSLLAKLPKRDAIATKTSPSI